MLAFKLMAIFAVAYAQISSGAAAPEKINLVDAFALNVDMKMVRASRSGGYEEVPKELVNSGCDESESEKSETVRTVDSKLQSSSQQTSTEGETNLTSTEAGTTPTTTEAEVTPAPLPHACPAEYEAFWVSDYSEAEKRFLARFPDSNVEDCCRKIRQDKLEKWMELSFSMDDGVCTLYTYAPANNSEIGPPPNKDGNDKILYVKKTPRDLCTHEYENETFQWPTYTSMYLPSSKSNKCVQFYCYGDLIQTISQGIKFGDDKCLHSSIGESVDEAAELFKESFAMFNIFTESDELTFASHDWTTQIGNLRHLFVDVVHDSAVDEYRWRQSLRPLPINSPLWAPGYPTDERHPCVAVFPDKLRDLPCLDDKGYQAYLLVRRFKAVTGTLG